jgi:tight adherence protein C
MTLSLAVALVGTFIAVALGAAWCTEGLLTLQAPGRRRLRAAVEGPRILNAVPEMSMLADQPTRFEARLAGLIPKSPKEINTLRRQLMRAGHHSLSAAIVFSVAELAGPVVLGALPLAFLGWPSGIVFAIGGAVVGFLLPGVVLSRLIEKRKTAISNGLPDALDLLTVCLEAGYGLDHAIAKTSEELSLAYPPLAEELKLLATETRAGKPRVEAFRNVEGRTKNEDVRGLVGMLVQTDRFGTSVAQALRTFSVTLRTKRRQVAQERAAKLSVKLVFPLVLFLFPALYVVVLGSAIVQIVRAFM